MTVYEATSMRDYRKIALFIADQEERYPDNPCFLSWRVGHPESTAEFIKHCKETRENYMIFWVEDERGNVRALQSIEVHDIDAKNQVCTYVFALIHYEDLLNNNRDYYTQMIIWMVKNKMPLFPKVKTGEFWVQQHLVEWTKQVFNGFYVVDREAMFKGQKIFRLIVDLKKMYLRMVS